MTQLVLRDYQKDARDAVLGAWDQGHLNAALVMSTGLGKTEVFISVLAAERARCAQEGKPFRACVIAHREELVFQPTERIAKHWIGALPKPGIIMGGAYQDFRSELVTSTVQTMAGRRKTAKILIDTYEEMGEQIQVFMPGPTHMKALKKAARIGGPFTHVIIDECHHAVAETYQRVLKFLRKVNPQLRHLGVTATPKRADQAGLIMAYDKVAYRIGLKEAIEQHRALVPFVAIGFVLPVSLSKVHTVAGDYDASELADLLSVANIEQIIIEKWKSVAKLPDGTWRQTMLFTATVAQAESLAEAFRNAGVNAASASGKTPRAERRSILQRYNKGEITMLVNCALWTEGVDAPVTSCIGMARPTKSDGLYMQCVGRGLRLWPNKKDCLILDFAPMDARDIVMAGDLLGVPVEMRRAQEKAEEEGVVLDIFGLTQQALPMGIDADPDRVQMQVLDFFGKATHQWTFDGQVATVTVDTDKTLAVVFPQQARMDKADDMRESGQWSDAMEAVYQQISSYQLVLTGKAGRDKGSEIVVLERLGTFPDWDSAQTAGNEYAEKYANPTLAKKLAPWRREEASDRQKRFAQRLGTWSEGMDRGATAQAITHGLSLMAMRKAGLLK